LKQAAVERMLAGEDVRALCREISVARSNLYLWRDKFLKDGVAGLRGPGQPRKMVKVEPPPEMSGTAPPLPPHAELVKARARIVELERKIGRQQLELDFFQQALRQVGERRQPSDGPGAKTSTPSSRR
jgi:transposase-like protein